MMQHTSESIIQPRIAKYFSILLISWTLLQQIVLIQNALQVEANNSLKCGETAFKKSKSRIYGGNRALPGQYPFQAYLASSSNFCGGVIIDEQYILTAAHCVRSRCFKGATQFFSPKVFLGTLNLASNSTKQRMFESEKVIVHEKYCSDPKVEFANDIALIKLNETIKFSITRTGYGSINKICLPDAKKAVYRAGEVVELSGWGLTEFANYSGDNSWSSNPFPYHLRAVETKLVSNQECEEFWSGPLGKAAIGSYILKNKMICTSTSEHKSACIGDSGSPLSRQRRQDGLYELVGLASGSLVEKDPPMCLTGPSPNIYTRVFTYLNWIHTNMDAQTVG